MPNPAMSPAVQAALQRRMPPQGEQGQLDQTSPDARMANPSPQPTNPSDATRAITPPAAPQPKFEPQDRKDLITMALIEQLKSDNKLEKQGGQVPPAPPMPQSQPAPMPPMGGGYSMGGSMPYPQNTAMAYGGGYNNSYGGSMSNMDKQSNPWKQDQERFWK